MTCVDILPLGRKQKLLITMILCTYTKSVNGDIVHNEHIVDCDL